MSSEINSLGSDADHGTGWQPISTAPKDGTMCLLWGEAERGDTVAFWACGQWREFGDGSKGWIGQSFHSTEKNSWTSLLGENPTHWMPLPAPPVAAKEPTE